MRSPTLPLAISLLALGCGRPADPPATAAVSAPAMTAPAGPVTAAAGVVRDLDDAAAAELGQAFHDNPDRAERTYAAVRFRVQASLVEFGPGLTVLFSGRSLMTITLRSPEEVNKLTRGHRYVIEGVVTDWTTDATGPHRLMADATVTPSP